MKIQLAVAAASFAPRGFKIVGYEIRDVKTGNTMLSRGAGGKQADIQRSIDRLCEDRGLIYFDLHLQAKGEEGYTTQTTKYEWDSNEAVKVG